MPEQPMLSGPFLQVAAFCERVLTEHDGALSLIRVIDRFNITGKLPEMPANSISFVIVVMFKAGFFRGKAALKITPISPSGQELPALAFPLLFEGDDERGVNVQTSLTMNIREEGRYWFDVSLEGTTMTRMPLRIVYQQIGFVAQPEG